VVIEKPQSQFFLSRGMAWSVGLTLCPAVIIHQMTPNADDIIQKRAEISKLLTESSVNLKTGTIEKISTADLRLMFELYDQIFFKNWFKESFKSQIKFSLSRRMTRNAGLTLCPKNIDKIQPEELVLEIRMGVDFFFHYGLIEGSKTVYNV
jgi:hypothetical protein